MYNKGIVDATISILRIEEPSALLGGLGPTIIGYDIERALKFSIAELLSEEKVEVEAKLEQERSNRIPSKNHLKALMQRE